MFLSSQLSLCFPVSSCSSSLTLPPIIQLPPIQQLHGSGRWGCKSEGRKRKSAGPCELLYPHPPTYTQGPGNCPLLIEDHSAAWSRAVLRACFPHHPLCTLPPHHKSTAVIMRHESIQYGQQDTVCSIIKPFAYHCFTTDLFPP